MAVNVTNNATDETQVSLSGRISVRDSNGIPYVLTFNGVYVAMWKGNSSTPTSFSEQDQSNRPGNGRYKRPGIAIDTNDLIHVAYWDANGMSSALRYATFDASTDLWSTDVSVHNIGRGAPSRPDTSIAIDANDVPHIAWVDSVSNMGTAYSSIYYTNKVGGSWNTARQVEGASAQKTCISPSLSIDDNNYPFISYENFSDKDSTDATATSNNPSSFTLTDRDTGITTDKQGRSTFVLSDGTKGHSYIDTYVKIYEGSTERSTGTTPYQVTITTTLSAVAVGTDIYVFYINNSSRDVCYDVWDGSSWAGETVLETGTFEAVWAKWSWEANFDSGGTNRKDSASGILEIDYCFNTQNDDIWFGTLTLSSPPAKKDGLFFASV